MNEWNWLPNVTYNDISVIYVMALWMRPLNKQETAEDGMAGLQSKFQNFNTKVNRYVDRQTDIIDP